MIKMPSGNRIYGYPSFPAVRVREMKKRGVLFFFRELKEKFILTCSRHAAKHWEPLIQKFLNYASLIFLFSCLCCCCCFLSPWVTDPPLPTPPHSHKVVRNRQSMRHKQCETFIGYPDLMFKMLSGNMFGYPSFPTLRVGYLKKRGTLYFP